MLYKPLTHLCILSSIFVVAIINVTLGVNARADCEGYVNYDEQTDTALIYTLSSDQELRIYDGLGTSTAVSFMCTYGCAWCTSCPLEFHRGGGSIYVHRKGGYNSSPWYSAAYMTMYDCPTDLTFKEQSTILDHPTGCPTVCSGPELVFNFPVATATPPVASFKSLNVNELGRSDEETFDGAHMVGGSIRFDATASYDSDGQIITYEWDFDNGAKCSTDASNICDVIFQEARIYNVTLTVTDNDGLTNTWVEQLDLTLKEGDLIFIRTAWWNIPFNIVGNDYTHVGMYIGGQWMIESILTGNARSSDLSGVVGTPISGWSYPSETFATLVRVKTADDKIRQNAVAFALSKLGQVYDLKVWKKSVNQRNYYCSELIWAAYYKASKRKIDLGNKGKKGGVWPDDIINDAVNTQVIGYHWEHNP